MSGQWEMVTLGDLLKRSNEQIDIEPEREYREVTARLWGKGIVLRGTLLGSSIASERRYVAHSGQFIISRIDARHGSMGIVPDELEGAVVTNDYPLFDIDHVKLDPQFFSWLCKTRGFIELCRKASEGTTNRVRLKEDRFLSLEISLPPLDEQRRIVARIEEISSKLVEVDRIGNEVSIETELLWQGILDNAIVGNLPFRTGMSGSAIQLLDRFLNKYPNMESKCNNAHPGKTRISDQNSSVLPINWVWTDLGSVLTHLVDCVNDTPNFVEGDSGYIGLKSNNIKPFHFDLTQKWFVSEDDYKIWNRREEPRGGDIVLTREAPVGQACILPDEYKVCLTQRLLLLRTDPGFVIPDFILFYLNSTLFQRQVSDKCRGLTTPHINVGDAPKFLFPLPPRECQEAIIEYLNWMRMRTIELMNLHLSVREELDALMPSILDKAFKGEL